MLDTLLIIHLDLIVSEDQLVSEQNHSSFKVLIGKEVTGELDEILNHLLNCKCNLTSGFSNFLTSITNENHC